MNKFLLLCLSAFFMNFSLSAQAVTISDSMKQAMKTVPDTPGMTSIIASLIVVILMIYVVGWFYMRLTQLNSKSIFKHKNFEPNKPKIVSGITLGQNKNLYVVSLNNRYLVLGVTPNNINLIKEFTPQEEQQANDYVQNVIEDSKTEEQKIVDNLFDNNDEEPKKALNKDIEDICNKYL